MKLIALSFFLTVVSASAADEPKKPESPKSASLTSEEAYHFKYLASRMQVLNEEYSKLSSEFNTLKAEQEETAKVACGKIGVTDTSKCSIDTDKKTVSAIQAVPPPQPKP